MDDFKIGNFRREHPGRDFPQFTHLTIESTREIRERLRRNCGLSPSASDLEITRWIADNATALAHADPQEPGFDLTSLLRQLGIEAKEEVLMNWFRYDNVDRMSLSELSRHFTDIWYPGSDDLEIFDDTCAWVLLIPHSGDASVAVLSVNG